MKKILLPLCALAFTVANVSAEKQLVKQTNWGVTLDESGAESARTDNGGTTYYYDKNNNLVLEALAGGYTQYSYTYTADGKLDKNSTNPGLNLTVGKQVVTPRTFTTQRATC